MDLAGTLGQLHPISEGNVDLATMGVMIGFVVMMTLDVAYG